AAALRALHQPPREFVLQLVRRPALAQDANGHGCPPSIGVERRSNLWLDSRAVKGRFAGPPGGVVSCAAPHSSPLSPPPSSPLRPSRLKRRPPRGRSRPCSRPVASSAAAPARYKPTSASSSAVTAY